MQIKKLSFIILIFFLVLTNTRYSNAAPYSNYLVLNGGQVVTSLTPQNQITIASSVTVESWINPASVSGIQKIISIGDKTSNKLNYEVGINGGSLSLQYRFDNGSQRTITTGSIVPNTWNHIAITISSSQTSLFINGKQILTTSGGVNLAPLDSILAIGSSYAGTQNAFKGLIDEVRISTISRNIVSLWNQNTYQSPLSYDANTFVLYHFDELRGQFSAADASINQFTGLLIGGDNLIHFFGVLPSPTPYALSVPTLRWTRPSLPTISFPNQNQNNPSPTPTNPTAPTQPTPTLSIRIARPVLHR